MAPFYKVSGAGNDFIALPEPLPAGLDLTPATIRAWCTRRLSLGADGLFLLARGSEGAHDGKPGTVRMTHYNADGSRAELCINGTRCAARLAWELGWVPGEAVTILTDAGPIPARRPSPNEPDTIALELDAPTGVEALSLEADGRAYPATLVDAGVPHLVLFWPEAAGDLGRPIESTDTADLADLGRAPVTTLGAALRGHPDLGPAGANVDFVRVVDRNRIEIRSYERGVEGETMACGTGVLAAVAAGRAAGRLEAPVTARTRGGFDLRVASSDRADRADRLELSGDARLVARGDLLPAASNLPALPDWE